MTLRQALTEAAATLATDPQLASTLAATPNFCCSTSCQIDRATLLAYPDRSLTSDQLAAYDAAIARRLGHEPIQYITGQQEFFGLQLKVTPATLIPRPETEILVEAVLDRLPHDRPLRILDIGTGTGAIALALAAHLPQAGITAIDLSSEALEVARENAVTHHLDQRIRFLKSDLLTGLPENEQVATFDAIVSNPPYIPERDRSSLHPRFATTSQPSPSSPGHPASISTAA